MMFVNAYSALIEDAKVTKGDFVLISAASSSAGLAAIQIANYAGAMRLTGAKGARIALDSKADTLPQGRHVSLGQERSDKMPHACDVEDFNCRSFKGRAKQN
jgi:NADPH-dependent curcumin reductase CurA